ncbi:hypothetical protein EI94DRAFT_1023375 [Lactarius quietus]|nr:hypothetical protein EI94DRAFT_1023375 [Lactarius quietus]
MRFKKQFKVTTADIQGSGWGWFGYTSPMRILEILTTTNKDPSPNLVPLLASAFGNTCVAISPPSSFHSCLTFKPDACLPVCASL